MRTSARDTNAMNGDQNSINDILIYMSKSKFPKNEI